MHVEKKGRVYLDGEVAAAAIIAESKNYASTYPNARSCGALPYVWLGNSSRQYGVYIELTGYEALDVVRQVLNHPDPWIRQEFMKLFDPPPAAETASPTPVSGALLPKMPLPPHLRRDEA